MPPPRRIHRNIAEATAQVRPSIAQQYKITIVLKIINKLHSSEVMTRDPFCTESIQWHKCIQSYKHTQHHRCVCKLQFNFQSLCQRGCRFVRSRLLWKVFAERLDCKSFYALLIRTNKKKHNYLHTQLGATIVWCRRT